MCQGESSNFNQVGDVDAVAVEEGGKCSCRSDQGQLCPVSLDPGGGCDGYRAVNNLGRNGNLLETLPGLQDLLPERFVASDEITCKPVRVLVESEPV